MTESHNNHLRSGTLIVCLVVLLVSSACVFGGVTRSGDNNLTVFNGAEGALCSLRIKPASSQTFWGRNLFKKTQRLAPGETMVIDRLEAGYYDLDAFLCDDDVHPGFMIYDVAVTPDIDGIWTVGQP